MIRALACAALLAAVPACAAPPACPVPEESALRDIVLPHAREQVATRRLLDVLALGGAATLGDAAEGEAFSTPARLAARLEDALPGVAVHVATHAGPNRSARDALHDLEADLAQTKPALVVWSSGSVEAGSGTDIDELAETLETGIARIRAAGADIILINLQYAPSIARIVDLEPYREAVRRVGEANDVPVLDRYEMMRAWSASGVLDLDATTPEVRVQVARDLFDCVAAALANPIAAALGAPPP
jgi:hypothetical protein